MARYKNKVRLVIYDADGATNDAFHPIRLALLRHGIDISGLESFQKRRRLDPQSFAINPTRMYSCGGEYSDYLAAIGAGTRLFVLAYGFEDSVRLSRKFGVPPEVISTSPEDFTGRPLRALDLPNLEMTPRLLALQESS